MEDFFTGFYKKAKEQQVRDITREKLELATLEGGEKGALGGAAAGGLLGAIFGGRAGEIFEKRRGQEIFENMKKRPRDMPILYDAKVKKMPTAESLRKARRTGRNMVLPVGALAGMIGGNIIGSAIGRRSQLKEFAKDHRPIIKEV